MKKLFSLVALLFVFALAFNGVAFGWGSTGGDASDYHQLQETAVFMNVANMTMSVGDVVVLSAQDEGARLNNTLGCNVTKVSAADSVLPVGVVAFNYTTSNSTHPVVVITKGPALTFIADASDAVTNATAVGTSAGSGVYGYAGGGTNLGIALEAGDGKDGDQIIVWVDPTGAD